MPGVPDPARRMPDTAVNARHERFRACFDADYRPLRRYIARLSGAPDEADDLTQEAFVRLWRKLQHEDVEELRPWLYRVASNLVISRFKARMREAAAHVKLKVIPAHPQRSPGDPEDDLARRQMIRLALSRLSEPMRQCVLLAHAGLTAREIAPIVGITPAYVSTLVMRGHLRFRRECDRLQGTR